LKLDYASQLWMEKEIKSVANVTRQDVRGVFAVSSRGEHQTRVSGIRPEGCQRGFAGDEAGKNPRREGVKGELEFSRGHLHLRAPHLVRGAGVQV